MLPELGDSHCTSLHFSLLGVNFRIKSSYLGADNVVNNCCCALPRQEAAASLPVLLLYCQVGLRAPPKILAGAAEAMGPALPAGLAELLDKIWGISATGNVSSCWMSLQAFPESGSLPWCHQVLWTLCWQGTFLGDGLGVCTEDIQDTFSHLAGAWCSLLWLLVDPPQCCWPVVMLQLWSSLGPWSYRGSSNFLLKFWGILDLDLQGKPAAARSLAHLLNQPQRWEAAHPKNGFCWCKREATNLQDTAVPRNPDQPRTQSAEAVELSLFSK